MKRVTAALILLVALAAPLRAQTSTNSTADSGGVTRTNMNSTTTPSNPSNTGNSDNMNNMNNTTDENGTSNTSGSLPKTASPLPLLSLAGCGALASSLWLGRRRRA